MKVLLPTGGPAANVVAGQAPEPVPRPDEVLLKVEAFSVNRGETFLLEDPQPGWRPGKDVAGLVVQAAADGTGPAVGSRVVGHPPQDGWAEYVAVPVGSLTELPDSVSTLEAAALPLAGLTALRLLRTAGDVTGRRILITGASGGVGHYFTELAAGAGAVVTAVSRDAQRGGRLAELGAAEVVHDVAEAVGPFDIVLESTGGKAFAQAVARLAPRGTLVWFGQASREPVTVDFFDLLAGARSATIRHFAYVDSDTPYGEDLATLVRLTAAGRLHPELGLVADWSATAEAITALRERRVRGNIVLTLS
ncbi:zinc-binding dehydrogenase [Streptacidiphilus albus]|uniref:zinc-binding dehydrogenase n=1 Tax=Streptacidiphilus albus TaxID=105425 RepID=UPI00054C67F8|nr:zinc-binding dehydrogenase [Streptacidiphilus albus]